MTTSSIRLQSGHAGHGKELDGYSVAVLGGAGFLGHHLVAALVERGAKVGVVDTLQAYNQILFSSAVAGTDDRDFARRTIDQRLEVLNQAGAQLFVQDARDYLQLGSILNRELNANVVIHLATGGNVDRYGKDWLSTFDHSQRTLENALDCSRGQDIHVIYLSSRAVYGDFGPGPADEETPLNPLSIPGVLKLSGEKMLVAYQQTFGLPYTIIRTSALYGPRQVGGRVGPVCVADVPWGGEAVLACAPSDGIDFTCVHDVVEGVCRAVREPKARNQVFNLTSGDPRSAGEFLAALRHHFPAFRTGVCDADPLTPWTGSLSTEKAKRLLGFAPHWDLDSGLADYAAWVQDMRGVRRGLHIVA
jgi:nucleoside-diphosphate-sugar epimerase